MINRVIKGREAKCEGQIRQQLGSCNDKCWASFVIITRLEQILRYFRGSQIAAVWANVSPLNTCSRSFRCPSNCVSKEKETRKCYFSLYKIFLKQYFGLNFIRLKVKQEPKSREYNVCKRLDFPRFPGHYGGGEGGVENCWLGHIEKGFLLKWEITPREELKTFLPFVEYHSNNNE